MPPINRSYLNGPTGNRWASVQTIVGLLIRRGPQLRRRNPLQLCMLFQGLPPVVVRNSRACLINQTSARVA